MNKDLRQGVRLRLGVSHFAGSATPRRPVIVCDACEQAGHNGELAHAVEAGALARAEVTELGAVLAGRAPGRESDRDITAFDSTGLAIQDLAIALAAMEHAAELNLPTIDL